MWQRHRNKKITFSLIWVIFILSHTNEAIEQSNLRPKTYKEMLNERRIQNSRIVHSNKPLQNKNMANNKNMQTKGDKKDDKIENFHKIISERKRQYEQFIQNDIKNLKASQSIKLKNKKNSSKATVNEKELSNNRKDQNIQNNRLQTKKENVDHVKKLDGNKVLVIKSQQTKKINQNIQRDRRVQFDRLKENYKIQNDKVWQSHKRAPIIERLKQNNKVLQTDRSKPNNRIAQNNNVMKHHRRVKIDRFKPNNRWMNQNDRIAPPERRVHIARLIQDEKLIQNDKKSQVDQKMEKVKEMINDRKMQMAQLIHDNKELQDKKNLPKGIVSKSRRIHRDRRMWVATPASIRRNFMDKMTPPQEMPTDFNSSELGPPPEKGQTKSSKPGGWSGFWMQLMMVYEGMAGLTPAGSNDQKMRACYLIATTYMSALKSLRSYLALRYFYENNLQFEVGYLTNEIISKYQRMLELYDIATRHFFEQQSRNFLASIYMLHLYTNVLEMATVIGHLCNMMHELEARFKLIPKTGFVDYQLAKKAKFVVNGTAQFEKAISDYEKKLAKEKRRRARERRKMRKKNLYLGFTPTPPPRRPNRGTWPLIYGWSIEYFW